MPPRSKDNDDDLPITARVGVVAWLISTSGAAKGNTAGIVTDRPLSASPAHDLRVFHFVSVRLYTPIPTSSSSIRPCFIPFRQGQHYPTPHRRQGSRPPPVDYNSRRWHYSWNSKRHHPMAIGATSPRVPRSVRLLLFDWPRLEQEAPLLHTRRPHTIVPATASSRRNHLPLLRQAPPLLMDSKTRCPGINWPQGR